MSTSASKRRRTQVSYNLDPYKDLDSDPEAGAPIVIDADSSDDEEFTIGSPGKDEGEEHSASEDGSEGVEEDGEEDEEEEEEEEGEDGQGVELTMEDVERVEFSGGGSAEEEDDDEGPGGRGIADATSSPRPPRLRGPPTHPSIRITRRPGLPAKSNSKRERIESIYGNGYEALVAGIRARDSWITDPVLPKRKSLEYTPFFDASQLEIIDLGEGEQEMRWLDYETEKTSLEKHLPAENGTIKCILGPLNGQKVITFRRFGISDLSTIQKGRTGHMLNAGGHVMGMDWAPNRPKGFQYLAVSVKTPAQANVELSSTETPPAYARTSGPSHIQIWRVPSSSTTGSIGGKPSLAMIISHEWGTARSLKWCSIPRKPTTTQEIGYLGGIFSDGTCKIIKVVLPEDEDVDGETFFAEYTKPLFNGYIQDTLCTCLVWLSTHEVAVGCSNGFAAVWDIRHVTDPENRNKIIPPHHYLPLHQTYILDIQSCAPSYPHTIVTSSMDGHCRLTNLKDPQADSILTGRSRLSSNAVVWVDCIHTVLASEEGTWVKMYPLRRFWSSTSVARQSQGGVILGLAGSKCHPFVLAGGGEGEVVVFNPLRRTFHGKIKVYQQTWFQIEYSPKSDMYRVMEGFKMENISFKFETRGSKGDGHSTVFEERGGVTRVCWNPNTEFGGWAAAGTAGGLVRIEDLAI